MQRPRVVGHQHGQRLCGAARRPDRSGVVDVDELCSVVVLQQFDPVDPLDGGGDDPLRQERDRRPHRPFDLPRGGVELADGPLDEVRHELQRRLLTRHLPVQFPHPLGDAVDAEDVLDPVGHVPRDWDLDCRLRVQPASLRRSCAVERLVELSLDPFEVLFVGRSHAVSLRLASAAPRRLTSRPCALPQ